MVVLPFIYCVLLKFNTEGMLIIDCHCDCDVVVVFCVDDGGW